MNWLSRATIAVLLALPADARDADAQDVCPSASMLFYWDLTMQDPAYRCRIGNVVVGKISIWHPGQPDLTEIRPTMAAGGWFGFEIFSAGLIAGTFTGDQLRAQLQFTTYASTDAVRVERVSMNAATIHSGTFARAQVQIGEAGQFCEPFAVSDEIAFVRIESENAGVPHIVSTNPVGLSVADNRSFCAAMGISVGDEILNRPGSAGGAGIGYTNFQVRVIDEPPTTSLLLIAVVGLAGALIARRRPSVDRNPYGASEVTV